MGFFDADCGKSHADSTYQGYDREHPNIDFPYEKPKKGELTGEEKEDYRGLGGFRVRVEHGIGRTKRFRIVSDRYRKPRRTHRTKTAIVAGMVNMNAGFAACCRIRGGRESVRNSVCGA